jgi:acetolactate synthase I/II/III large subunit
MGVVMAHLRATLPRDAILTNGAGNFAIWPNKLFRYTGAQRLLAPQSGAMGYGVPAAIAAKAEHPDRTVVCFAGDGDFQMTGLELATAVQAGAAPVVLVLNNGTYGTIRMHQERHYPARVSGTDLVNPDFAALARAMGLHGERVAATADFAPAFARALASPTGAVLDLDIGAEALTPRETLSQMRAKALAAKV